MYDDQERPAWLRNLRPPRREPEPELYAPAPTFVDAAAEPGLVEAPAEGAAKAMSRRQLLFLAFLLWGNISVLGCLCLLATQVVVP